MHASSHDQAHRPSVVSFNPVMAISSPHIELSAQLNLHQRPYEREKVPHLQACPETLP